MDLARGFHSLGWSYPVQDLDYRDQEPVWVAQRHPHGPFQPL